MEQKIIEGYVFFQEDEDYTLPIVLREYVDLDQAAPARLIIGEGKVYTEEQVRAFARDLTAYAHDMNKYGASPIAKNVLDIYERHGITL